MREEAPIVGPIDGRSTLTFYCNDEVTPLADPSPSAIDNDTDVDPFSDIVMGSVDELRALLSSPTASGVVRSPDNFDDGVYEVYGPLSKRSRLSIDGSAVLRLDPTVLATQVSDLDSEERLASVPLDAVVPEVPLYNQVDTNSAVPLWDSPIASVLPAATAEADSPDDGPLGVTDDEPGAAEGDVHQITQDEDMDDAHVFDEVAQQLSNVAEDGASDELFDRIDGHEWHDGQLMFQVRWKTDEVSVLPFSLVKRDFPSAAAIYVLEHNVGNAGGRYSGGRYTRWARQYNLAFSKVV